MNRRQALSLALILLVLAAGALFVTDRYAKRQALQQEEAYLQSELARSSCVTNFDTSGTVGDEKATVVDRSLDGRWVRVSHPYWYDTDQTHADTSSEAVYYVGLNSVYRVNGESPGPVC
ncbi:hypothetical protein GJR96_07595 [Haloferax sp. MBLA0076]|uniref:Uncharacterized protein n=1 Tax=Haloferax litoreum TaxID=2666140 RepID=A0A6A8GF82_9EURY|nr:MULTISPECIES: hypothetical protein [Haloferax]KAB1193313.1 hypothetical protein Hfx1148_07585 [Haloferax sp. CBA1148]MRX21818.1 hypothetical protein [Haloferax litoreum]